MGNLYVEIEIYCYFRFVDVMRPVSYFDTAGLDSTHQKVGRIWTEMIRV